MKAGWSWVDRLKDRNKEESDTHDHMLDQMSWADKIEACVDKGVSERPPVEGVKYVAFTVHPPLPGNLHALAIAHRDGEKLVQDVIREDISVPDAAALVKSYGITKVTGTVGDVEGALAHATMGALSELLDQ